MSDEKRDPVEEVRAHLPLKFGRQRQAEDDRARRIVGGLRAAGLLRDEAEIAARERAAREKALREAAAEVDCGCAARSDVLKWLAESGERRARSMCAGHGDACCALQAAAILALIDGEAAP